MKARLGAHEFATMAAYAYDRIERSTLTNAALATAIGASPVNLVSMYKGGATKVPIDKAMAMAEIFGDDEIEVLRLALRQYDRLTGVADRLRVVNETEMEVVEGIRQALCGSRRVPVQNPVGTSAIDVIASVARLDAEAAGFPRDARSAA